jgi:alkyl hydroperoxide reductase subunit F
LIGLKHIYPHCFKGYRRVTIYIFLACLFFVHCYLLIKKYMKDLVIIGAGAAGMTAAVYAARRHLDFSVVATEIGGELAKCGEVGNWPGVIETNGIEMTNDFLAHIKSYDVSVDQGLIVEKISQEGNVHTVHAKSYAGEVTKIETKTVIITTGVHPRELGITGEAEKRGMGVTYCTVCDGPLFKGKTTATIGAGNSAVESALMMATIAKKVYLLTKYPNTPDTKGGFPKAEDVLVKKLKALDTVEIIYNANTTAIDGEGLVASVTYEDIDSKEAKQLEVQGVMVHIGIIPNSNFIECAEHDKAGQIDVDTHMRTSCPGVFAAGDVTTIMHKQIVIAAGQGATAALTAIDYINRWEAT